MMKTTDLPGMSREEVSKIFLTKEGTTGLSPLARKTQNDPNRHTGISSSVCNCGLVHDDELLSPTQKRARVVEVLGGRCVSKKCRWQNKDGTFGCTDKRILQVDHVYDDGFLDRARRKNTLKGSMSYWTKILVEVEQGSDRYQILCANCNWMKRVTTGAWALEFGLYKAEQTRKETKERKQKEHEQFPFYL